MDYLFLLCGRRPATGTFRYMDLGGRTALLTGATGGLGRAIATALAARGAKLILSSRKTEELVKLARSLPGGGHTALVADLAEEGAALALLEQAGDIDVLVANAALPASGSLEGFSQDEIGRALRVNLESPVRMTRELLPHWLQRGQRSLRLHLVDLGLRLNAAGIPLRGHEVRAAGLRAQSSRGPAQQRGWRFGDRAGSDSRRGNVRRERRRAAARDWYRNTETGG